MGRQPLCCNSDFACPHTGKMISKGERSVCLKQPKMYLVSGRIAMPLCHLRSKDVTALTGKCFPCH